MEPEFATDIPPAEQDERTRNRLLRAAAAVFDRKGYASASVREIVEIAGVTKPALYYHFGSKERLLIAILEEAAREFDGALATAVGRTGTTRERLTALCEDVYALFERNVPVVRVAHAVFLGPVEGAPAFDCGVFDRSLRGALERIVEDGRVAGELRPAASADVAFAVIGVLTACAERQLHIGLEPVGIGGMRRILTVLFDGVLTDHPEQGEPRS